MKRIEYFCRNIRHGDPIEEQMEEAKRSGIIKSYTLTTLSAMNVRRNADLCLWCDEIWSADHIHSCLCVPDHNCMFTCGIDFEIFAFVKVAKEGLKNVVTNDSQGHALVHCAEKMFEEMCDTNLGIPSEEGIISSAPQMFDELSQSVLTTNPGQIIEEKQDNNALISDFDSIIEIQADDECTHGYGNEETQADGRSLSHNLHLIDELYDFKVESNYKFVKDIQPDAHNMLDELPLPTFIKEMVEAAKIVEIDAILDDYEPASAIQRVQADQFTQKQQLFAKLGTLEGSHCRDLVIICANGIRFSTISHSLISGCQHSEKMTDEVDKHYDGKMNSEYHCFEVSMVSSIVSNAILHIGLVNNVVLPLLWSDSDWFMGSSLSVVLGVNVCKSKVFELGYDCRSFSNTEEVHNLKKLNYEMSPDVWIVTTAPNSHKVKMMTCLFNFIAIDADKVALSCSQIAWSPYISECTWFYVHSYTDTFQEKGHYKFFDPGIGVEVSYTTTLEDKGDFRGEEDTSKEYNRELFTPLNFRSHFSASRKNMSHLFFTFVFDPGILFCQCDLVDVHLQNNCYYREPSLGLSLRFCVGYLVVYVLNALCSSLTLLSLLLNLSYTRRGITLFKICFLCYKFREGESIQVLIWEPDIMAKIAYWTSNVSRVGLCKGGIFSKTTEVIPFLPCCLAQLNLLQSSNCADREVAILIFDPGGYGNGQKVHRLKAYQNGGNRFSEKLCQDYQCYVFDPGGPLMPVNDAMVTNPRPGMCYACLTSNIICL